MSYCDDCGNFHNKQVECPFIWQICKICGNESKASPDVPSICDTSNLSCGRCGAKGAWRFTEPLPKCSACKQYHPADVMCPPHEMRFNKI